MKLGVKAMFDHEEISVETNQFKYRKIIMGEHSAWHVLHTQVMLLTATNYFFMQGPILSS